MKGLKKSNSSKSLPEEVRIQMALESLYHVAKIRGWDLTASLIGAAADSIVQEYSVSTAGSDLESFDKLFFVPPNFGGKPN